MTGCNNFLFNSSYLRHIIESMSSEDSQLMQLLSPSDNDNVNGSSAFLSAEAMRSLYLYESKMSLLTRLASTAAGAELLLESGKLGALVVLN